MAVGAGNHRRLALESLSIKNVLVSIIENANHNRIVEEFIHVNKAISVPELYKSVDIAAEDKLALIEFVKNVETLYPKMVSKSKNCQKPNFNPDILLDQLYEYYENEHSIDEIISRFCEYNEEMTDTPGLNSKIEAKCIQSGLWVFCKTRTPILFHGK